MAVATPLRCLPGREGVLSLVDQAGESGLEDRYVDSLPVGLATLPSEQRRENRDGPEQPGHYVADRHPDLRRVAAVRVHEAGDRHQARFGLQHEVVTRAEGVRAGGAVPADREVHEVGVESLQGVVVQAETRQAAHPVVLEEHVRPAEQPPQDFNPGTLAQIQAQRPLVPVYRDVVRGDSWIVG